MKNHHLIAALMIALTAMLSVNAFAGPKEGKGGNVVRGLDVIHKALEAVTDLSDQQKTDTTAVLADAEAQIVALRDEAKANTDKADKKALRQKVMEITLNTRTQIETLLTDAQKTVFGDALKAARAEAGQKKKEKPQDGTNRKNKGV